MSPHLVIIEKSSTGFSAFLPDIPGCIATGSIKSDVEVPCKGRSISSARTPRSTATYVEVAA